MANGTFFADASRPDDTGDGLSEANAKKTLGALFGLGTGGGNTYYVQAGTNYTLTAAATFSLAGTTLDGPNIIEGYMTTPGARDGRPVITTSTNSIKLLNIACDGNELRHLKFTNTAATKADCIAPISADRTGMTIFDCVFDAAFPECIDSTWVADFRWSQLNIIQCDFRNCVTAIANSSNATLLGNYFYNCETGYKFAGTASSCFVWTGFNTFNGANKANSRGIYSTFNASAHLVSFANAFYDMASDAIRFDQSSALYSAVIVNNIFDTIRAYAVNGQSIKPISSYVCNNFFRSITSGNYNRFASVGGDVELSASPWTNPGSHDFTLNNTVGGGAAVKAAGWPGVMPFGTGYLDGGPLQHQDQPYIMTQGINSLLRM